MSLNIRNHIWGFCVNISKHKPLPEAWKYLLLLHISKWMIKTLKPEQLKSKCDEEWLTQVIAVLVIAHRDMENMNIWNMIYFDTVKREVQQRTCAGRSGSDSVYFQDVLLQLMMVIWKKNPLHHFYFKTNKQKPNKGLSKYFIIAAMQFLPSLKDQITLMNENVIIIYTPSSRS